LVATEDVGYVTGSFPSFHAFSSKFQAKHFRKIRHRAFKAQGVELGMPGGRKNGHESSKTRSNQSEGIHGLFGEEAEGRI
jgi:hypothetical protein